MNCEICNKSANSTSELFVLTNNKVIHKRCYILTLNSSEDRIKEVNNHLKERVLELKPLIKEQSSYVKRLKENRDRVNNSIDRLWGLLSNSKQDRQFYENDNLLAKYVNEHNGLLKQILENEKSIKAEVDDFLRQFHDFWNGYPNDIYDRLGLVIKERGYKCEQCQASSEYEEYYLHHKLMPRNGGSNKVNNLILLCSKCKPIPEYNLSYK